MFRHRLHIESPKRFNAAFLLHLAAVSPRLETLITLVAPMSRSTMEEGSGEVGSGSSSSKAKSALHIEGYPIEGLSIGGQETCVIFPTLKCAFDIGRCPQRAIAQDFVFISHGHMDHIVSLSLLSVCVWANLVFSSWSLRIKLKPSWMKYLVDIYVNLSKFKIEAKVKVQRLNCYNWNMRSKLTCIWSFWWLIHFSVPCYDV